MHRLYSPSRNITKDKIIIDDKDLVHHARDVLRLRADEEVVIFNEKKEEYSCVLGEPSAGSLVFEIKRRLEPGSNPSGIKISIACAIPKGAHMDAIVDKLTQLGVHRIIPMETERVIVKLDKRKKALRLARWEKIALNASLQSQRNTLPILEPVRDIEEVLAGSAGFDLKLIPALFGRRNPLKEALEGASLPKNILVMIGPEGDFTDSELESAKNAGFLPVTLGNLVLRVETAAVSVAGFIRLYYENR